MKRAASHRYVVTGPGLDPEPSYTDVGPAISRALTAACKVATVSKGVETTFYVRDSISGDLLGYSETDADGNVTTRRSS